MAHYQLFWAFLLFTCGYALWRGNRYEKLTGLSCILATAVSVVAHAPLHERYVTVEMGDLLIDLAMLGVFVVIALRSDRFWPLWVAGLQLTISMSHLFKAIDLSLMPRAYAAAERFWSYPILIIVFVGAWRSHSRPTADGSASDVELHHFQ
jgi:hypothetical protein